MRVNLSVPYDDSTYADVLSNSYYRCLEDGPPFHKCPGYNISGNSRQCGLGYLESSPLCQVCDAGYSMLSNRCEPCDTPQKEAEANLAVAFVLWCLGAFILFGVVMFRVRPGDDVGSDSSTVAETGELFAGANMAISYYQLLGVLSESTIAWCHHSLVLFPLLLVGLLFTDRLAVALAAAQFTLRDWMKLPRGTALPLCSGQARSFPQGLQGSWQHKSGPARCHAPVPLLPRVPRRRLACAGTARELQPLLKPAHPHFRHIARHWPRDGTDIVFHDYWLPLLVQIANGLPHLHLRHNRGGMGGRARVCCQRPEAP